MVCAVRDSGIRTTPIEANSHHASQHRVRRTAPDGTVVRYLYDGDDLLAELDGATGQTIREYTYYPGVDRPHSVRAAHSGATYYYATDHPGNVVGLINGAQQLENEYRYVHFGEVQVVQENIGQPLRFAAREWDDLPGLYQVRARWYDPQSGRFVSEDPIGLAGGINPYVYANNNPINLRDPSGLKPGKKVVELAGVTSSNSCEKGWVLSADDVCVPGEDDTATPTGGPTGAPPSEAGEKGGPGNGTGTGAKPPTPAKSGRELMSCVWSVSKENFLATNRGLFTPIGAAGRTSLSLVAGRAYGQVTGSSSIVADAVAWGRSNPGVWISTVRGETVVGGAGARASFASAGAGAAKVFLALELGVAIGSAGVGLGTCIAEDMGY